MSMNRNETLCVCVSNSFDTFKMAIISIVVKISKYLPDGPLFSASYFTI